MPKKKLTKTQVKKEYNKINTTIIRLFNDKMQFGSKVPMSTTMLLDILEKFHRSQKRIE